MKKYAEFERKWGLEKVELVYALKETMPMKKIRTHLGVARSSFYCRKKEGGTTHLQKG